ncbi:MAG: gliding motility-associated C-terminal domain-containing protein [Bacteroidota bacterium]
MPKSSLILIVILLVSKTLWSQQIIDPCFNSIRQLGKFKSTEDIVNVCRCAEPTESANLIEWDGTRWLGTNNTHIKLPPPSGCNTKALWMGYQHWNGNGEAFALRLDKPLEQGQTYTYTFTYAKDGDSPLDEFDTDGFAPIVYTDKSEPSLYEAFKVGRLPATKGWTTQTLKFVATKQQAGHQWLILHGIESSGTILSNCQVNSVLQNAPQKSDTTLCMGEPYELKAAARKYYTYEWNTGAVTSAVNISTPGTYSVTVRNHRCSNAQSVSVRYEDCEVRLEMPNIFTPNGDAFNAQFVPKEYNYVASGVVIVYDRTGEEIYRGDLFDGWNGGDEKAGVYFFTVLFVDKKNNPHKRKGMLTLVR